MSSSSPPESMIRSELWYRDGNIVLQAENTQFRVHWGVLAQHSSVFRDMEELPQPPDQPTIDGCPIVELSDGPKDVENLLKAMYIPAFYCQKKLPLPVIDAHIRLGRKYDCKYFFDLAVARLTAEFPAALEEFDAIHSGETSGGIEWKADFSLFHIIAVASNNNILSALPSAYYRVVQSSSLEKLFDGLERTDGTRASLDSTDLRRCVIGRQTLLHKQLQAGYTLGWTRKWEFSDCISPAACGTFRENILSFYLDEKFVHIGGLLPSTHFYKWNFCPTCANHITDSIVAGRKKIWDEMPEIFGLSPWSELKNDI
ncbi:BTB domain-containing protein [Mycena sanguinolenta]|uniref:BTB domain-containing protein n=1 Tax=Mycena sanguinolenta TaxID=230812 RepID=A0A8H7DFH4_9AGAR|nr:BTB domain-containing protein [Mycena sanguinolenta]